MTGTNQPSLPHFFFPIPPALQLLITPICLAAPLPEQFAPPKFHIGQTVLWSKVPSHGFGRVIGFVFAHSVSVQGIGYHYAIALDDNSPSRSDCPADWAFEDDLDLIETHAHSLPGEELS
jgi:hypothetical protein